MRDLSKLAVVLSASRSLSALDPKRGGAGMPRPPPLVSRGGSRPAASSKRLLSRQQRLKATARAAWTQVPAALLFDQFLVAVHDAQAALDAGFGVESPSDACSVAQQQKRGSS